MASNIADMASQIAAYQYNPAAIQRTAIQTVSDVSNGVLTIVDPTNPLVFLLEAGAVMVSSYMAKDQTLTRQRYPKLAQTPADLYYHMADQDYLGRFATPATATFQMLIPQDTLDAAMVADTTLGYSKIVIPRDSVFSVANTNYCLQYPIEIRLLTHGGYQVVYDLSVLSPLQTLNSNVIDYEFRVNSSNGTQTTYLWMEFTVTQMSVTSSSKAVNASTLTTMTFNMTDSYYYTRLWYTNDGAAWIEMSTTHNAEVYDATVPTGVLNVDGSTLTITIPQVYTTATVSGGVPLLTGNIRADVYTTKGVLSMVLGAYAPTAYSGLWQWLDNTQNTTYSAPLNSLSLAIYSTTTVAGGTAETPFTTLKEQVINNTVGQKVLPITNVDAQSQLSVGNYQLVSDVDNITNRKFLATRAMPTPTNSSLITGAGSTCGTFSFEMADLVNYSYVVDNGTSMTITPSALYKDVSGLMDFVSDAEIAQLAALSSDQKAITVSAGGYRYSPFHYVLDNTLAEFAVRPYYLDGPSVITKVFVGENDTTQLQVVTGSYDIARTTSGYLITVTTSSNDGYKAISDSDVQALMLYTPNGETTSAYILGTLTGTSSTERVFTFDLSTNYNVNSSDALELTQFVMFTDSPTLTAASLLQDFSIIYCTTSTMPSGWVSSAIDTLFPSFLVPSGIVAISQETLRVQLGYALDRLWANARTVASSITYETYTVAEPALYTKDVYVTDAQGSIVQFVNGEPVYTYLHRRGDPVLDASGNPVILHAVGDPVLDVNGAPIPTSSRGLSRQVDIFLIEGVYLFGTDSAAIGYKAQMVSSLVSWLTNDLETIEAELIEQTDLYFYPQQSIGAIVVLANGVQKTVEASQSLVLNLYVTQTVYDNTDLREELNDNSIEIISAALTAASVSVSAIQASLLSSYGTDVVDAQLSGFGGSSLNMTVFTVTDNSTRCSLKKVLVAESDNTLIIQEDVTINYIVHDTATTSTSGVSSTNALT